MKNILIFIGVIVLLFLLSECVSEKKVEYDFPQAMLPHVKTEYTKQCDKGQILYNINCAKCHTTKSHGHRIIPDFRSDQLKGYELRLTNQKHESNLTDSSVTAEELSLIMTFLNYKKRNTVKTD